MIGVVGNGYVGKAICNAFHAKVYDIVREKSDVASLKDLPDPIFVCVPTPMKDDGSCDISIIRNVLKELNETGNKLVVIKSTIPPGSTESFSKEFKNLDIVFSPEFLTEANYIKDFLSQKCVIFGYDKKIDISPLHKMFHTRFNAIEIIDIDSRTAEMVKYITNSYLATKISWANEIKQICDSLLISYDDAIRVATHNDSRIGNSHVMVPGKDGEYGFGSSCLPKDLNSLIFFAKNNNVDPMLLTAVWEKNIKVRKNRDWEKMKGRAIV